MRSVLLLVSLSVVLVAAQSALPSDVAAGFYPGRSAPIVVKPDTTLSSDAAAIFLDPSSHQYYAHSQQLDAITAQNIADVTLRSVGLAPVSHEWGSSSFVKNDFFDRARASVSLLIESVGDDVVNSHNLANLKNWRASETSARVEFNSYPSNSLSFASSIASGVSPSSHGIVARSWSSRGQVVRAYSDASATAQSPTVADILSSSFDYATAGSLEGKPLTVSASSDAQLAAAHCAHTSEVQDNSYCVANAQMIGARRPLTSSLSFTPAQINSGILDLMGSLASLTGAVSTSASRQGITINYPGGVGSLLLSVPEHRAVLAELQYALSVASHMSSDRSLAALAQDDAPDFFAFTFASLTPLLERFGRESTEFIAALHLVDAVLPQLVSSMSAAYGERAVFQVIMMGTHESIRGAQDTRAVASKVTSVLGAAQSRNVRDFFPYVYATFNSASQLAQMCATLNTEVAKTGYSVYCPAPEPMHYGEFIALSKQLNLIETMATSSGEFDGPSHTQIQRYQIALWFSIGISFVLAAIVYSIMYMDIKRDSLVYAQYNPMWENRKGSK